MNRVVKSASTFRVSRFQVKSILDEKEQSATMLTRRSVLQAGSLALGGLALGDLYRLRAAHSARTPDTSVILLWLQGAASHLETYDLKPDAPAEVRGEFRPIRTRVPGVDVCEHLPLHARVADRFSLIRSIAHTIVDHPGATGRFLTGHVPANISDPISKVPTIECVTGHFRQPRLPGVPALVSNTLRLPGGGPGYLGSTALPLLVNETPTGQLRVEGLSLDADLESRLPDRNHLRADFDHLRRGFDSSGPASLDHFHHQALEMLSHSRTRDALDLNREPAAIRDRYGSHPWSRRCLLARRLVEAGCSFVTIQLTRGERNPVMDSWDDHGDVGHIFKSMRHRLPVLDHCIATLIEDIYQRGLDRRVLLIVASEFGRTPRINMGRLGRPMNPGRDHWPHAMSVLVSGGGWRMGQVVGSTNARAETPANRPLSPNDFLASVYHFLGIDPSRYLPDQQGRPQTILPGGRVIKELVG